MLGPASLPRHAASSAERGFLWPRFIALPTEGQDLDDFMQQYVAGISGIDVDLVRSRFQDEPPNYPATATWAATGVVENEPVPGWAYIEHQGANSTGRDYVQEQETFTLLTSFYGPDADARERQFTTGVQVPQNREILQLNAMGLVDRGTRTVVPRLINMKWRRRVDRRVRFTRLVREAYPVLNVLNVTFTAEADTGQTVSGTVVSPSTM